MMSQRILYAWSIAVSFLVFDLRPCAGCFYCTEDVLDFYAQLPAAAPENPATVELCSGTVYDIGNPSGSILYRNGTVPNQWINGQPPILARSYTHYKCGSTGSSNNGCVLLGGHVQFWSPKDPENDDPIMGVVVQGVTFQSAETVAILLENSGEIEFIDCIIKDHYTAAPVMMRYSRFRRSLRQETAAAPHSTDTPSNEVERSMLPSDYRTPRLAVSFQDTQFRGNTQQFMSSMFTYGIISSSNLLHDLTITNCTFENNTFTNDERGYLVQTFGATITVEDSWFADNKVSGWGLVQAFSWDWSQNPLIQNNDGVVSETDTGLCPFVAFSETIPEIPEHVQCIQLDGSEFIPNIAPTPIPVHPPSPAPVPSPCYGSIQEVNDFLRLFPDLFSFTIEFCPNTVYTIGSQDSNGNWVGGEPPLLARSSTIFQCGSQGVSSNGCVFRHGDKQFWSNTTMPVTAVEVRGITFEEASDTSILLESPGHVTFVDCVVQNHVGAIPVLSTGPSMQLSFVSTVFRDNEQLVTSSMTTYGVITVSDSSNTLTIDQCSFSNNVYDNDQGGYIIRTNGSPLSITNSDFTGNVVSGWGLAEALYWNEQADPTIASNSGTVPASSTLLCPFLALSHINPSQSSEIECIGLSGDSVTSAPSDAPSTSPSNMPSITPATVSNSNAAVQSQTPSNMNALPLVVFASGTACAVILVAIVVRRQLLRRDLGAKNMMST